MATHPIRALFRDRARMQRAVRALEHEGVDRGDIDVRRAQVDGDMVEAAPEAGASLRRGAALGVLGGFIWVVSGLVTLPPEQAGMSLLFRLLSSLAVGALLGATLGAIVGAVRRRAKRTFPSFLVEVDASSSQHRRELRHRLEDLHGEPLKA